MITTLILGAGFGGIATARTLREHLGREHRIVVVDRATKFHVGATKNWVMLGYEDADAVERPIASLLPEGVELVHADIESIDAATGRVVTTQGEFTGDFLVVALGAELHTDAIPGLAEAHTFYSLEGAAALREPLAAFDSGQLIVLTIGKPYKCPPAPYEAVMLLHEFFVDRGVRDAVRLSLYSFEGAPLATAGKEMGELMRRLLGDRGIELQLGHRATSIDHAAKSVSFENGREASFDLLLTVPPNRPPAAVRKSDLVDASGWVTVDPKTMQVNAGGEVSVFAIGDVTRVPLPGRYHEDMPLALPKAGIMAEAHGRVVGERIAAIARGQTPSAEFDGQGFCYIETARHEATRGGGDFFALPHPRVERHEPSAELHRQKAEWVKDWLTPVA